MDAKTLGKKLKLRRKELGFTQQQLSLGICSQAQLSRIEKGLHLPSTEKLILLLSRLNLSPSILDNFDSHANDELIQKLHNYVYSREYQNLYQFICLNNLWTRFIEDEHLQLLYYFEGLYFSHYLNDQLKSLNHLFNGLKQTNTIASSNENILKFLQNKEPSISELLILGAIGSCYFMLKNYSLAEQYFTFSINRYLTFDKRNNFENIAILLYSSAKNFKYLKFLDKAQNICEKGLEILTESNSTFRLAELNYELAEIFRIKGDYSKAELHYITAITVAKASCNNVILKYIITDLKKYKDMTLLSSLISILDIL